MEATYLSRHFICFQINWIRFEPNHTSPWNWTETEFFGLVFRKKPLIIWDSLVLLLSGVGLHAISLILTAHITILNKAWFACPQKDVSAWSKTKSYFHLWLWNVAIITTSMFVLYPNRLYPLSHVHNPPLPKRRL